MQPIIKNTTKKKLTIAWLETTHQKYSKKETYNCVAGN